jgi:hypothetical protein
MQKWSNCARSRDAHVLTLHADRQHRKLESVAYHEAGHAVACIELRRPFKSVTIVPKDDSLGHLLKNPAPASIRPEVDAGDKVDRWLEREVSIVLVGLAAEHRHTGRHNWRGARRDLDHAVDLASYLHFDPKLMGKYLTYMVEKAKHFVADPLAWIRIEALATALMKYHTLSARRARAVCQEALLNQDRIDDLSRQMVKDYDGECEI